MTFDALVFYILAAICVAAAVGVVVAKNPVHSGLFLVITFFHVAAMFVMLGAEFLAAVQVIVYAGAILVLYLFVLMLLNLKTDDRYFHAKTPYLLAPAAIGLAYLVFLLVRSPFSGSRGDASTAAVLLNGDAHAVGIKMFSDYLLQFEIIGVFLTGAIVGAIVLAKTPKSVETRRDA